MKKRKFKLSFAALLTLIYLLASAGPVFASMGSTTGGGSGSGSSYTPTRDIGPIHIRSWQDLILVIVTAICFIAFILFLCSFGTLIERWRYGAILKRNYQSTFLAEKRHANAVLLLKQPPNQTYFFHGSAGFRTKIIAPDPEAQKPYQAFKECYIQAQFLYSQLLREQYVNKHADLSPLTQYLDRAFYYKTMKAEIKKKSQAQTVDETVVDSVIVKQVANLDEHMFLMKLKVYGQDKELQFNHDFEPSFSRSQWTDTVLFGQQPDGKIKIVTLLYGEHTHLNGEDLNNFASSDPDSKYEEQHLD